MLKITMLAGALALLASSPASAQYWGLPPGVCAVDAYGNMVPCGYYYGGPGFGYGGHHGFGGGGAHFH